MYMIFAQFQKNQISLQGVPVGNILNRRCGFSALTTWLLLVLACAISGCATPYLDNGTPEISVSEYRKPASPQAVQLVFEFQTKGAPNAFATKHLKEQVLAQVRESGLFASASEEPAAGAALLSVTLDNVPVTSESDAMSKGFVTGLTFGLAGSQVTDGYICTVKYLPANGAPLVKTARHAIHSTMGAAADPSGATKMESFEIAVRTMTRQVLSQALNSLSRDPDFK